MMTLVLHGLAWLVLLGALAYLRAPAYLWLTLIAAALGIGTISGLYGSGVATALWIVFALGAFPVVAAPLRRKWISAALLRWFRSAMPTMSDTEREALEAGTVWWDGELFSGRPRFKRLLSLPAPYLTAEEQAFLDGPVNELCRMIDDWRITHHDQRLPEPVWQYIKDKGFFGMIIPKRYGGLDFSALAHSSVVMKIASRSITAAVTVMVPNSLGPAKLLLEYGTDEQKNHYLPRLARGQEIPCFALTGPEAGSDAAAMPDRGVVCHGEFEGRSTLGIRLNWDKRYITLGPVATVLGLAFKLYDPDHLLGDREELGITLALIPTGTPGVDIGRRHFPLNIPFQNGPNRGHDVFIPIEWIIGGPDRVGQGWRMLMESLADGRSISLPALSTASGKLASRATGAYARIRRQFRVPIGRFEGIQEALARIAGHTYIMDAVRTLTAVAVDQGEKPAVLSAVAKYHCTERMRMVVNDAMDVHGGSGICLGPRNVVGRAYQAVPIGITVEGANILTRSMIIFGQGAIRCHPFVLREMRAAGNPDDRAGLRDFDRALFGHVGFVISNVVRSFVLGMTGGRLVRAPCTGPARRYVQQFSRFSACFALAGDVAMLVLGGSLKRREALSSRYADVLSGLYIGSALIKQFQDHGSAAAERPLLDWSCRHTLHEIQRRLDEILYNFPNRFVAAVLRALIFPLGMTRFAPDDRLSHRIAEIVLQPSAVRDRLCAGVFISDRPDEATGRLEIALSKVVEAEPIEQRLHQAVKGGRLSPADADALLAEAMERGMITELEAETVRAADAWRREVIQVDDFDRNFRSEESAWQSETPPIQAGQSS